MRQGQNRRMRGRNTNNRKGPNPLQRGYESNGPDVKVRGNAQHIAEKYVQLARDAQSSGDRVMAENYLQHAEHYFRLVLAAQEQLTQQYGTTFTPQRFGEEGEDGEDDGEDDNQQPYPFGVAQPASHGEGGETGYVQQGYDGPSRLDSRQDRGNQDRGNQQDRSEGRFDRNSNQRFDRNGNRDRNNRDRQERHQQDRDRNDRGPRQFDRSGENQPDEQPRPDRNGAERQERNAGQRNQDIRQDGRQDNRGMQPRAHYAEGPEGSEQPRMERGPRPPRPEPSSRPDRPRYNEGDVAPVEALPAFLTNPVRVPVVEAASETHVAASIDGEPVASDIGSSEAAPKKPRGRPRRSPREVMDALAIEPTSE